MRDKTRTLLAFLLVVIVAIVAVIALQQRTLNQVCESARSEQAVSHQRYLVVVDVLRQAGNASLKRADRETGKSAEEDRLIGNFYIAETLRVTDPPLPKC